MLIEISKEIADRLSKTELGVVRFMNENENKISELSIVEIAFETFSSPSTVSRAIRKCGLNGFNELRKTRRCPNSIPVSRKPNFTGKGRLSKRQGLWRALSARLQALSQAQARECFLEHMAQRCSGSSGGG